MSVTSGFYNSVSSDRLYDAKQMSELFDGICPNGVFSTVGQCFKVYKKIGDYDHIYVGTGLGYFNHMWVYNDDELSFDVSNLLTYYMIVVTIDETNRELKIEAVEGFSWDEDTQIPLARIRSYWRSIKVYKIFIGTNDCPIITGPEQQIIIEDILSNFDNKITNFKSDFTDEINHFYYKYYNKNEENLSNWKLYVGDIDLPNEYTSVQKHFVILDGEIHALGSTNGRIGDKDTKDHYKLNKYTKKWEYVSTLPYEFLNGCIYKLSETRIVIFGGYNHEREVWEWTLNNGWSKDTILNNYSYMITEFDIAYASYTTDDKEGIYFYIAGGYVSNKISNKFYVLSLRSTSDYSLGWNELPSLPDDGTYNSHKIACINGIIYYAGYNNLYKFINKDLGWEKIGPYKYLYRYGLLNCNNKLHLFYDCSGTTRPLIEHMMYDFDSGQYIDIDGLRPLSRYYISNVAHSGYDDRSLLECYNNIIYIISYSSMTNGMPYYIYTWKETNSIYDTMDHCIENFENKIITYSKHIPSGESKISFDISDLSNKYDIKLYVNTTINIKKIDRNSDNIVIYFHDPLSEGNTISINIQNLNIYINELNNDQRTPILRRRLLLLSDGNLYSIYSNNYNDTTIYRWIENDDRWTYEEYMALPGGNQYDFWYCYNDIDNHCNIVYHDKDDRSIRKWTYEWFYGGESKILGWVNVINGVIPNNLTAITFYNGEYYVFSGKYDEKNGKYYKSTNRSLASFVKEPYADDVPFSVYEITPIIWNGKIHLFGGFYHDPDDGSYNYLKQHYVFDGKNFVKDIDLPHAIADSNSQHIVVWNGDLHLLGGSYDDDPESVRKHYKLVPGGAEWIRLDDLPYDFYGSGACVDAKGRLHVIGGYSGYYHYMMEEK